MARKGVPIKNLEVEVSPATGSKYKMSTNVTRGVIVSSAVKAGFNFHQTFGLDTNEVRGLLTFVAQHPSAKADQLAAGTGLGTRKVMPVLKWARFCGLIQAESLQATECGQLVLKLDADFLSPVTKWLLHWRLATWVDYLQPDVEAPVPWLFFIHQFLPERFNFSRAILEGELDLAFGDQVTEKYLTNTVGLVLKTYTHRSSLGAIGILEESPGLPGYYCKGTPTLPNSAFFAACFEDLWQKRFPGLDAVGMSDLLHGAGGLQTTIGLSDAAVMEELDKLIIAGAITINRSVKPHVVVRTSLPTFTESLVRAYG